jgi:hypothetical protein
MPAGPLTSPSSGATKHGCPFHCRRAWRPSADPSYDAFGVFSAAFRRKTMIFFSSLPEMLQLSPNAPVCPRSASGLRQRPARGARAHVAALAGLGRKAWRAAAEHCEAPARQHAACRACPPAGSARPGRRRASDVSNTHSQRSRRAHSDHLVSATGAVVAWEGAWDGTAPSRALAIGGSGRQASVSGS